MIFRRVKSKYGNHKTQVDGHVFDSAKEAERYKSLVLLERAGSIDGLRIQVPFVLAPGAVVKGRKRPPIRYIADFVYLESGEIIVEDCKGVRTDVYRLKRHLMMVVHGVDIRET